TAGRRSGAGRDRSPHPAVRAQPPVRRRWLSDDAAVGHWVSAFGILGWQPILSAGGAAVPPDPGDHPRAALAGGPLRAADRGFRGRAVPGGDLLPRAALWSATAAFWSGGGHLRQRRRFLPAAPTASARLPADLRPGRQL